VSLALATLIYEWRRYLAAVIALAVAGLLVLAMTGMFMGMSKSFTATVDRSPAEVMILPSASESLFDYAGGQPRRIIPEIHEHSSVQEVQALNLAFTPACAFDLGINELRSGIGFVERAHTKCLSHL